MVMRGRFSLQLLSMDGCIAIGIVLVSALAIRLPVFERLELQWIDASFSLIRAWRPPAPAPEVVILGFDAVSLRSFDKPFALIHEEIAQVLDALRAAQPQGVAVDMVFPSQDYSRFMPGSTARLALAIKELRSALPLVIGAQRPMAEMTLAAERTYAAMAGIDGTAYMLVPTDMDGALRRLDDRPDAHGQRLALLAPALVRKLEPAFDDAAANGMIDFTIGPPFSYTPAATVLRLQNAGDGAALAALFRNRIVVIGGIFPDQDRQRIPVPLANWEPTTMVSGVVFQAQAIRSLLRRRMIAGMAWPGQALALISMAALWLTRKKLMAANFLALALAISSLAVTVVFLANGIHVTVASTILAIMLAVTWMNLRAFAFSHAERRRIQAIFAGYVSPAILDSILDGKLQGGQTSRHQLAFLFADIRGFTAFGATREPEQVIAFLNRYYTIMTEQLHRHGGTVDKFSGDGIMVFFGAPQPSENACRDAVLAGCAMLAALEFFNRELAAAGEDPISIGIGIAFGDAVIGNVGSAQRHDYTATGAATNLAAHIQQHCKQASFALLVEETAFNRAALAPECERQFQRIGAVNLDKHGDIFLAGIPQQDTQHG
jgi:adenylate cyclase